MYLELIQPLIQEPTKRGDEITDGGTVGVEFYAKRKEGIPQWYRAQWISQAQSNCLSKADAESYFTFYSKKD